MNYNIKSLLFVSYIDAMLDILKNLTNDTSLSKIKMLPLKLCAQRILKRSLSSLFFNALITLMENS